MDQAETSFVESRKCKSWDSISNLWFKANQQVIYLVVSPPTLMKADYPKQKGNVESFDLSPPTIFERFPTGSGDLPDNAASILIRHDLTYIFKIWVSRLCSTSWRLPFILNKRALLITFVITSLSRYNITFKSALRLEEKVLSTFRKKLLKNKWTYLLCLWIDSYARCLIS